MAVMSAPTSCPGQCIYCPTFADTPQSYTPHSPAVIRGAARQFDPYEQVKLRLHILGQTLGHPTEKVELIVMGGTFLSTSPAYQEEFVKRCLDGLNDSVASSLIEAQHINEKSANRCVGMCFETRPDVCSAEDISRMVRFGATRVELGVQLPCDEVYRLVKRGHTVSEVKEATQRLKNAGLKVYYHFMPGLPSSSPERDLALFSELFSDLDYRPDGLKIYPLMVVSGTELEKWWQEGKYHPYSNEIMMQLLCDLKAQVPPYVRISRVLRDIPPQYVVAGLKDSLRLNVRNMMAEQGKSCQCIRCREIGHRLALGYKVGSPKMHRFDYEAAKALEVFLTFEDEQETLFGLLRLRLGHEWAPALLDSLLPNSDSDLPSRLIQPKSAKYALVRELHVFGRELELGQKNHEGAQHKGYGKALLIQAEKIAWQNGYTHMAILSGIGAREYYRASGYRLLNGYMVKVLGDCDAIIPKL